MKANDVIQQVSVNFDLSKNSSLKSIKQKDAGKEINFQDMMTNQLKEDKIKQNKTDHRDYYSEKPFEESSTTSKEQDCYTKKSDEVKTHEKKGVNRESKTTKDQVETTVKKIADEIKDTVKEKLNLSDEELEAAMKSLGLTYVQLLDQNNLAKLFMEVQGINDPTMLLTNESISSDFNSLMDAMNTIDLSKFDLTKEDAINYIQQMSASGSTDVYNTDEKSQVNADEMKDAVSELNGEQNEVAIEVKKYLDSTNDQSQGGQADADMQQNNLAVFLNNLSGAKTVESFSDGFTQVQQVRDIVNQVVEQIRIVIKPEQTSMEMNLNPENLGKLRLVVEQKDGLMTAQFTVQNEVAKEALESQLQTLKDNFSQQGLKVQAVEVNVSEMPFSQEEFAGQNEQQGKSPKKQKSINLDEYLSSEETLTEEEEIKIDIMSKSGNRVDYTA